jgi:DNA-binding NtrC family response regulator
LSFHGPASPRRRLSLNILVIDDEEVLQDVLGSLVRREGHVPIGALSGEDGLAVLEKEEVDLILLDLMLPGLSGMEVLRRIRQRHPEMVVVVITAYSSVESAIEAMREGAFHYIPKPFKNDEVRLTIRKGLEQKRLTAENRSLRAQLQQRFGLDNIIGKSKPMQAIFETIHLAAPSKSNILVLGESGTGKELFAKAIHHHSRRADGPFVTVNSGSMPSDLLESNLFGHVKGAFTGAISSKKGLFELANGGSIFFDEIGNIPMETQAKLLRVIQEKEFMRLGGVETLNSDVRIIAATNADLEAEVQRGNFREDLFYRLHVISVHIPPLRKRTEDIPALAHHFLRLYSTENDKDLAEISPQAMELLLDYHWPGNVRELENVIERAVVLSTEGVLDISLLPMSVRQPHAVSSPPSDLPSNGMSLKEAVQSYERQLIIKALRSSGGVQKQAAKLLKVKPTTLHEMMKRLEISAGSLVH